jgi:acyl carrier protein
LTLTIFEEVRMMASDLFGTPTQRISVDSSPETIEGWDSIQHLNLVLALEERFRVQLSPEEMEQMHTMGQIVKLLESKLQATPSRFDTDPKA